MEQRLNQHLEIATPEAQEEFTIIGVVPGSNILSVGDRGNTQNSKVTEISQRPIL